MEKYKKCQNCEKMFEISNKGREHRRICCSKDCVDALRKKGQTHYSENYTPKFDKTLVNWETPIFTYREKRDKFNGYLNYWKVKCRNCGYESTRNQSVISLDSVCSNCNNSYKGYSGLNRIYLVYQRSARDKGILFEFSIEEFKNITSQPCHYCGVMPYKHSKTKGISLTEWGDYIYNGIDQIECNKGYTKENCVPCCEICNFAKSSRTYDEFINWLDRITKFRSSKKKAAKVIDGSADNYVI